MDAKEEPSNLLLGKEMGKPLISGKKRHIHLFTQHFVIFGYAELVIIMSAPRHLFYQIDLRETTSNHSRTVGLCPRT